MSVVFYTRRIWYNCLLLLSLVNKLHAIRPTVGDYKQKTCLSRRDRVLLNRLHIGHTHSTHSFLLSGDDLPQCGTSQCPLTVKHILIDLKDVRNKHFVASSIKDLFDNIEAHINIDFIKETRFYKQLYCFHINVCYLFFYSSLIALILHS